MSRNLGGEAFWAGKKYAENPFKRGSKSWKRWNRQWVAAEIDAMCAADMRMMQGAK